MQTCVLGGVVVGVVYCFGESTRLWFLCWIKAEQKPRGAYQVNTK